MSWRAEGAESAVRFCLGKSRSFAGAQDDNPVNLKIIPLAQFLAH
jgi:hypothetical protein